MESNFEKIEYILKEIKAGKKNIEDINESALRKLLTQDELIYLYKSIAIYYKSNHFKLLNSFNQFKKKLNKNKREINFLNTEIPSSNIEYNEEGTKEIVAHKISNIKSLKVDETKKQKMIDEVLDEYNKAKKSTNKKK